MTLQAANKLSSWQTIFLLLAVLILATALRLTRLDLAEFKADEAGITRQALALVREGQFPAVGPSSSQGPAHPPLQIYLLALPFAFTQDPRPAIAVVALIHVAAVLMTFLIGARFFNQRVGLIAAFLFAVSPWAIYYARKMWTQNWPLATALFIFSLLLLVVERRAWALAAAGLALIAVVGTHLGGLAFVLILLLVLLLFRSRVERRPLLVGAGVFILFALPYLYHDATHNWSNLRGFFDIGAGQARIDLDAARFAAWLSSGFHYQDLAGARYAQFLEGLPNLRWLDVVEMVLLGAGVIYLFARVIRHALRRRGGGETSDPRASRDVVLLLWLLVPVVLQTRHSQPVYPHYFILLYPAQFLVIALLVSDGLDWLGSRVGQRAGRWLTMGAVALIVTIGVWQVYLQQTFMHFVEQYDTPDGYGPVAGPLLQTSSVAGESATDGAEILVIAEGDDRVWDNLPSTLDVLLPPGVPHRMVDGRKALVFPARPTVYIVTPEMDALSETLAQQPGAVEIERIQAPGERSFRVFRRENESRDDVLEGMTPLAEPRRLANGVELLAFRTGNELRPGDVLPLTLAWWLDGLPPSDVDYHAFAHLVDGDGKRLGQHDLSGFPTASWQTGDLVLVRFQIGTESDTPPGEYWVRLGMYSFPEVVNAPVLDAAGNPTADAVVIGPIQLH